MSELRSQVLTLVRDAAASLNPTLDEPIDLGLGEEAPLYGKDGVLDSLDLVSLVLMVEEKAEDTFGKRLTLTDDRALSRYRSPFRTLGSFTDYVAEQAAA